MNSPTTHERLSRFLKSGIYRFENSTAIFIDPVRVLNRFYTRFRVSPTAYYSRFFDDDDHNGNSKEETPEAPPDSRKRKRKKEKKPRPLNETELIAQRRHQEVRPLLLKAHETLLGATELLAALKGLRSDGHFTDEECRGSALKREANELNFVELGRVWQSPLYEISLNFDQDQNFTQHGVECESGFNLILIDPPWENSSAHQKLKYRTLPNRYFLSLPIEQLTHTSGALVALWVTNREKLRRFVENELFPSWGVKYAATFYWLKVKADGQLISQLDLFHHRPYECLVLGYSSQKDVDVVELSGHVPIPDNQVFISVPGDYSRKPPIGDLLLEYVPGSKDCHRLELFARELGAGWNCWGNEPLHFQDTKYILKRRRDR
ncbi:methyltransferase-like protein 2 isoform X2 [Coffea arabica]|uniref:Methyltransferase-like protein 2 isoform X2 n=1 Tax=Coffea arabica TaxID=13443 RepID=A0A6P6UJC8_COFAR|nr:methyltransferase-like protein 2 isoform X3 [Coffea arabica]